MCNSKMAIVAVGLAVILSVCAPAVSAEYQLQHKGTVNVGDGGAEIVDYSADGDTLAGTVSDGGAGKFGVQVYNVLGFSNVTERAYADFSGAFGAFDSVSSTALDTAHRGFGVAALIPADNGGTLGKVGFYDYTTGAVLHTVDVGYHPDCLKFSADGNKLFVANEGETTVGGNSDAPGSLSVIDLSGVTGTGNVNAATVATYDFSIGNLGAGVDLTGLRINDTSVTAGNEYRHAEPEFISISGGKVFVTLQENNAVGVFDTASNKWTAIRTLGTITQRIDASDKDGYKVDDPVKGMPMPDTIATFTVGATTYYVTANEGDFHPDDIDRIRIKDIDRADINDLTEALMDTFYFDYGPNGFQENNALGRLRVSTVDGRGSDGKYEQFITAGTRSFTVWNATTGEMVSDTGSLEPLLYGFDPLLHNINDGDPGEFDKRSDDKGPEPEGLAVFDDGETLLLAVGMERQNGILLYDLSDPDNPVLLDYINNLTDGLLSPESLMFVAGADNPTGEILLLVGYEDSGSIGVYQVTVPEPATMVLLGIGGFALLYRRKRRRRCNRKV